MTAMGRDGSTVQNAKLTTGERLMLVGLIACGLLGLCQIASKADPLFASNSVPSGGIGSAVLGYR